MRLGSSLVVGLALAAVLPTVRGHGDEPKKGDSLMQRKLRHTQKVLEGIALGDFVKIADNAEELIAISKKAEWKVVNNPKYELHSNEFRRSAAELVDKARDKNLDGATLAYLDLTLNCVRCHKFVREVRQARLPPEQRRGYLAANERSRQGAD
jgi:hypothetical protein